MRNRGETKRPRSIADLSRIEAVGELFVAQCRAAKALGFDSVLIARPVDEDEDRIAQCARAAKRTGLLLVIDIELDRVPATAAVVAANPAWFRAPEADAPDPRRDADFHALDAGQSVRVRGDAAAALNSWWLDRLQRWVDLGAAGFRARGLSANVCSAWRRIAPALRSQRRVWLAAATPGLAAPDVLALAGIGFDAAFSSFAWWDGNSAWFYEEDARLRRIAAQVFASVSVQGDSSDAAATTRSLWPRLAAAIEDGLLAEIPDANDDFCNDLREANKALASREPGLTTLRPLLRSHRQLVALLIERHTPKLTTELWLGNPDPSHLALIPWLALRAEAGDGLFGADGNDPPEDPLQTIDALQPRQLQHWTLDIPASVVTPAPVVPARAASSAARIAIEAVAPQLDVGRFAVKRCVGDRVVVSADIFSDGHDHLGAAVAWRCADGKQWQRQPLRHLGNDRWSGEFGVGRSGRHEFFIEAWRDDFATLRDEIEKKQRAGVLTPLDLADARRLLQEIGKEKRNVGASLQPLLREFDDADDDATRAILLTSARVAQIVSAANHRPFLARSATFPIEVERLAARYASWYELFPRSLGKQGAHGSFDDVVAHLPRIRAMGFDVLYMPPIHPIGMQHRKGRNNSLNAAPGEPGSPYAIGSSEGAHDAVHAELGGIDAFRRLIAAASAHGIEIALDFAVQCSPDHPWLRAHPGWFNQRADGSIRHAENPPKKYEDIVNVDFFAADAIPALWTALLEVVLYWAGEGVRLFRVDNPHTKPLPFWEWLIASVRSRFADAIFLSEAFTRPKPMYRLAKLGFSQSYTYFIWRNDKRGLTEYLRELNQGEPRECFRPHLFVNTPDINPYFLQQGGRPAHLIRAALAATLSGLWGVYSGFELCEASALPGREEYLDSEKYQLREWDWQRPGNIVEEITRLNALRRCNPELQTHLDVEFLNADNDQVLYFAKGAPDAPGAVLIAISLDPYHAQASAFEVPLWRWGLADEASIEVEDLWDGNRFNWHGKRQYVELDLRRPFAIWRIDAGTTASSLAVTTTNDGGHA